MQQRTLEETTNNEGDNQHAMKATTNNAANNQHAMNITHYEYLYFAI